MAAWANGRIPQTALILAYTGTGLSLRITMMKYTVKAESIRYDAAIPECGNRRITLPF